MHKTLDIVAIVGSLRRDSFTRRLVRSFDRLLPATVGIEILGIGDLPFYNQDMESSPPTAWTAFRKRINRTDAVLFATPEYNRSVPGVLKNAIDVGSRPYGSSVWAGKPAGRYSHDLDRRHGRIRREPPSAPGAGLPRHADDAAAGSVSRRCR